MRRPIRVCATILAACATAFAQDRLGDITIVVQDESGAPVKGALVQCVNWDDRATRGPLAKDEQGVTDAEGRVTFHKKTIGQVFARVRHGDLGGWYRLHDSGERPVVSVPIARGRTVRVEVMEGGKRLSGVSVFADGCLLIGETDANGLIEVPNFGVKRGDYAYNPELTFIKEGYARESTHVHFDALTVHVTLRRAVTVEGVVLGPDGKPRAGAHVYGTGLIDGINTDKNGRFAIAGVPIGEEAHVGAFVVLDGKEYRKDHRFDVDGREEKISITLQLEEVRQGKVRIRVVDAETGKPVMATILTNSSPEFAFPRRQGLTREDGTFDLSARADSPVWVGVQTANPTLYSLDGIVTATYKEPAEDIVFKMAEGCAIRGRVLDAEGKPAVQRQVMFQPMGQPYRAIWTQPDGRFTIPALPGVGITYTLTVHDEFGRVGKIDVGPMAKGEIRSDVEIRMPPATSPHMLRGVIVDAEGRPVPSARLMFRYLDEDEPKYVNATADDQGRFEAPVVRSGRAKLQVSKGVQIMLGRSSDNLRADLKLAESEFIDIDATQDAEMKVVVASAEPKVPGTLRVTDENDTPIDADVDAWYDKERSSNQPGRGTGVYMLNRDLTPPFVIAVTRDGYQAKVLVFPDAESMAADNLHVRLKQGPFPIGVSVWSAVTGRPATEAAVAATPLAQRIRENERTFYEQAARPTEEERRAQQAASGSGPMVNTAFRRRVRVTDASGKPVTNLTVEPVDPGNPPLISIYRGDHRAGRPRTLTSANGIYDGPDVNFQQVILYAPGTGRVLYQKFYSPNRDDIDDVVLRPAASLEILARTGSGRPAENAMLYTPDAGWNQSTLIASSGPDGTLQLQDLAPGMHAFTAMVDAVPQLVFVRLADGEQKKLVIRGPRSDDDPVALLAQYRKENRPRRNYPSFVDEEWNAQIAALERGAQRNLRDAVCEELEGLVEYERVGWFRQELDMLTALAVQLRAKKAVAPLERFLRNAQLESPIAPALYIDSWVSAACTIADLAGDDAVEPLAAISANPATARNGRIAAWVGMGRIGGAKSVETFARLRDAAYAAPNAPEKKEAYTHAERIIESCRMVFGVLSGGDPKSLQPSAFSEIRVDEDYATATLTTSALGGGTQLRMKRTGDEWLLTELGPTVMH